MELKYIYIYIYNTPPTTTTIILYIMNNYDSFENMIKKSSVKRFQMLDFTIFVTYT